VGALLVPVLPLLVLAVIILEVVKLAAVILLRLALGGCDVDVMAVGTRQAGGSLAHPSADGRWTA
jgi:hypothetical protein